MCEVRLHDAAQLHEEHARMNGHRMSQDFVPLRQLHRAARAADLAVALHDGRVMTWPQLLIDIAHLRAQLADRPAVRWALYHEDSYPFAVALLGLLSLGKTVYLPANNTAGTTALMREHCEGLLGDFNDALPIAVEQNGAVAALPALAGRLVLFTSGSTGAPKAIAKQLAQLDAELQTHQHLWGAAWRDADVLATVSHQHIYGLLFKVLGPICSGRRFHSTTYRDPANIVAASTTAAIWIASPAHLQRLQPDWPWAQHTLLATFCSGGELAADAAQRHRELAGYWPLEIYGSSETGGIATRTQENSNHLWRPLPGVDIECRDTLAIRSGHLPDSEWLTTADRALAVGAQFELLGRADRIVKIEGKRLALPEVEMRLQQHPWITTARALLIERGRQRVGVVAQLTAAGQQQLAALGEIACGRELRIYLQQFFEPIVLPRLWRFPAQLPMNSQSKIQQADLLALFESPRTVTEVESNALKSPSPPTASRQTLPDVLAVQVDTPGDALPTATTCTLTLRVPVDLDYFRGHFNGAPVVPGVVLIRWVEHFARRHLPVSGICRQLEAIKFKRLVRPENRLRLTLTHRPGAGSGADKLLFSYADPDDGHDISSGRLVFEAGDD
jgi:acyl-coenzyme A synthetase/AMP-(fatty) acid ligase